MAIQGIPKSMLSAQLIEFNKPYKIHDIPTPESLGPYDVLLKVAVASLCHTDSMVSAGIMGTKLPCIGSHEGAGTVVQLGSSVTDLKKGDRVMAGLPRNRCGHCADCLGDENYRQYCPNLAGHVGVTLDGAFAEYMVVDGRESSKIPDEVSFETAAPLACAGCTIWRGILQTQLKKGETVAIVGAGGGLGHLGCQFAKALGLMVVGIDAREEGLALARDSGADVVVDAREEKKKVVGEVMKVTNGMGADATVNVSDNGQAAALACAVTKMHGTMIQIAQPAEVSVPFHELVFRDVRIKGSLICSRLEADRMLKTVAEHRISVKTNPFFGLREIPKLIELAHSGKMQGKAVVIPSNQIRLTNVSLVRLKKGKKRFEIACYKNKVLEYRSGIETDLDNVLQIPNVFLSVSKGQTAPTQDLAKAFGPKTSVDDIIQEILKKGEMQVGEKERHAQAERIHNEVVDIVAGKLVDPKSKRVYTAGMIEKALEQLSSQGAQHKQEEKGKGSGTATPTADGEDAKGKKKDLPTWTGVVTTKSAKSQALEAMKALIAWQPIPVSRARMRLRVTCPTSVLKQATKAGPKKAAQEDGEDAQGEKVTGTVKDRILSYVEQVETQDTIGQEWEVVGFVEPGAFKGLGEFIGGETKGRGRVEVLDMAVVHEGD